METILVTGATGKLGSAVVQALQGRGIYVRAAARHTTRLKWKELVQPVLFDYEDKGLYKAALDGVSGVFLIAPPLDVRAPEKLIPFIDKIKETGVRYVVFNSAIKADLNEQNPLRIIELYLLNSGIACTILRPNFFMENFTGWLAPMIDAGEMYVAADDAKTSFISVEDIAQVAAVCLMEKHSGEQYTLTGIEPLGYGDVARIISQVSGRTVNYKPISEKELIVGAREQGMSESEIQFMAQLFASVRNGLVAETTNTVLQVTGKAPITFKEFAQKNANIWKMRKAA